MVGKNEELMRERVGSCLKKIAQYCNVRELEVKASGKCCGLPQRDAELERGSENKRKDGALEMKVYKRTLAEGRETKMRPWNTMLPAAITLFDHCI